MWRTWRVAAWYTVRHTNTASLPVAWREAPIQACTPPAWHRSCLLSPHMHMPALCAIWGNLFTTCMFVQLTGTALCMLHICPLHHMLCCLRLSRCHQSHMSHSSHCYITLLLQAATTLIPNGWRLLLVGNLCIEKNILSHRNSIE